jgi:hypothetical protein
VSNECALQRRHADPATGLDAIAHDLLQLHSELLHLIKNAVFCLSIAIKVREEHSCLLCISVANENGQVDTTRSDECGIESVYVIRGEEYDTLFTRSDTVQSV